MTDLSALKDAVAAEHDVGQSAITLLVQLTDLVEANATDPAAIADIVAGVRSDTQALADAVTANTPEPPAEPPAEPPVEPPA